MQCVSIRSPQNLDGRRIVYEHYYSHYSYSRCYFCDYRFLAEKPVISVRAHRTHTQNERVNHTSRARTTVRSREHSFFNVDVTSSITFRRPRQSNRRIVYSPQTTIIVICLPNNKYLLPLLSLFARLRNEKRSWTRHVVVFCTAKRSV